MISTLSKHRFPYLLLLPSLLVILIVVLYPFLYNFWLSLSNMSLYHIHDAHLVGFENYKNILLEPELYVVLAKTAVWTFVNVFFHVGIGIGVAMLLNQSIKGRGVYRALLILPWAMPQYIVALTWRGMFNYQYGSINLLLGKWLHLPPVPWLSNETLAFIAATITNIWLGFPFMMIVALGAMQSIPAELYEAAAIDGASAWRRFRHVTLPMLKPIMVPAVSLG
ncbi:MAG: sugar ABC transporter permease, partial [Candidatus Eisenbacteria bacterium]|nr:sugar ABC transporter permease [Candidatus Eisenbacteria bacterium]